MKLVRVEASHDAFINEDDETTINCMIESDFVEVIL
tara:strand:- start:513061 stop:513168 length:108 start_codon:yes stop_codon:yes gene_type:complete